MVVKITRAKALYRCLRPARQVTVDTRVMKGPAKDEQALRNKTCGIHCRRSRTRRPEQAPCLPPGENRSRRRRGEGCSHRDDGAAQAGGRCVVDGGLR